MDYGPDEPTPESLPEHWKRIKAYLVDEQKHYESLRENGEGVSGHIWLHVEAVDTILGRSGQLTP